MTRYRSNRSEELNRLEDMAHALIEVGRSLQDLRDQCNSQTSGQLDAGATACRVLIEGITDATRNALAGPESVVRGMVAPSVSAIIGDDDGPAIL
jgi:hypothetical protein